MFRFFLHMLIPLQVGMCMYGGYLMGFSANKDSLKLNICIDKLQKDNDDIKRLFILIEKCVELNDQLINALAGYTQEVQEDQNGKKYANFINKDDSFNCIDFINNNNVCFE